jgi:hypothetical protein
MKYDIFEFAKYTIFQTSKIIKVFSKKKFKCTYEELNKLLIYLFNLSNT